MSGKVTQKQAAIMPKKGIIGLVGPPSQSFNYRQNGFGVPEKPQHGRGAGSMVYHPPLLPPPP